MNLTHGTLAVPTKPETTIQNQNPKTELSIDYFGHQGIILL